MTATVRLFVHGWYGAGNVGDELLLATIARWASEVGGEVCVASVNPEHTRHTHGLDAVNARDLPAIAQRMASCDLVVIGGGGLFQTHHSFTVPGLFRFNSGDIAAYARPALMAEQLGVPYIVWANGIGPLEGDGPREIVRHVVERALAVSVRDDESAALVRTIGVERRVDVGADPVWANPIPDFVTAPSSGLRSRLGIAVRPWAPASWEHSLSNAIRCSVDPASTTLVWLGFQATEGFEADCLVMERLQAALPEFLHETVRIRRPDDAWSQLASCDALICMRLHAQILALRLQKPLLCLEYDEKMVVTSQMAGLADHVRLKLDAAPHVWAEKVRHLLVAKHTVDPERVRTLEETALVHRAVLHRAINEVRGATRAQHWRENQFDWINTWSTDEANQLVSEREGRIAALREMCEQQGGQLAELHGKLGVADKLVHQLRSQVEGDRIELERLAPIALAYQDLRPRAEHDRLECERLATVERDLSEAREELAQLQFELATEQQNARALSDHLDQERRLVAAGGVALEELAAARDVLVDRLAAARAEAATASYGLLVAQRDLAGVTSELKTIVSSLSWRATHPIRVLRGLLVLRGDARRKLAASALRSMYWSMPSALRKIIGHTRRLPTRPVDSFGTPSHFDWPALANDAVRVAIVPSAFEFDELVNQRPINLAKYLASRGYCVIFAAWQWSREERLQRSNQEVYPGVVQVDLYSLLDRLEQVDVRSDRDSLFVFTLPAPELVSLHTVARARGFSIVYDILDDWRGFHEVGQAPWYDGAAEAEMVLAADVVAAVSPALADRFAGLRRDIAVIGNGYTPEVLGVENRFAARRTRDGAVRRCVGYFGHLTDAWFDWQVVLETARLLPQFDFEFIGYGEPAWVRQEVEQLENVRMVGKVPPKDLWQFANAWSVAIAPFRPGLLAEAIDPIKVYEYLYFGLPVVCTGIPHLRDYPGVRVVEGADALSSACIELADSASSEEELEAFLGSTTWQARFDRLTELSSQASVRDIYVR
ncbi:polysaccharide pyruvyl transferase family protein [Lysobacter claricitrinus]|uniref:polysaccharide pyruvyl transferase family protein n=1 Tax=Lysobacter claricitrinus TaxID=3367728 RepID=UPI0037DA882D